MSERGKPQSIPELLDSLRKQGVDPDEYMHRVDIFLERKARTAHVPLCGTFELTPLCNLDCKMCYVHLSGSQFRSQQLLPPEAFISLIDQAHRAGMLKAGITGGECLTYPGFDEVYLSLYERGIRTTVMTNGVLLNEKRVAFFQRYRPRNIQITLYGGSEDEYEAVTGNRVFEQVISNIESVRDAGLRVHLSITPNAFMRENLQPLVERAVKLGIPFVINAGIIAPRKDTGRARCEVSDRKYLDIFRIRMQMEGLAAADFDPAELPDEGNAAAETEMIRGMRCGGGRSAFAIRYDGTMGPCVAMEDLISYPLRDGFEAAWRVMGDLVDNYLIPVECEGCAYKERCITCPAQHREAAPGHCDRRICEKTKLMVREGIFPPPVQTKGTDK